MTVLAGALSLDGKTSLPDALCNGLRNLISRFDEDLRTEVVERGVFITKIDIGAFEAPAFLKDALGNVTMITGEPLIQDGEDSLTWNRADDTAMLHPMLMLENWDGLAKCRGTFSGVHYQVTTKKLALFVDKIGVRPMYIWVGSHYVVFSSALRVLEGVVGVSKELDLRGVAEEVAFNYALSDRTAYADIKMLKAGEVIQFENGQIKKHFYWRWGSKSMPANVTDENAVSKSYTEFLNAIKRRQKGSPNAAAFLSGGLDSRAIVGGLRALKKEVYTVNFAPDGTQDQVFAALMAEALGAHHTQLVTNVENVTQHYRKKVVSEWIRGRLSELEVEVRPRLMWSGDGGSVALGHVYIGRENINLLRCGKTAEFVTKFTKGFPVKIFKQSLRRTLADMPVLGVQEELNETSSYDVGRSLHLFFMLNDQRRHLCHHFENIDLDRIEFQLPFFDADFLETILPLPVELFLAHEFYMKWLERFPNHLTEVPWQAYPGHVQCTLPVPAGLRYQWKQYYDAQMLRQIKLETIEKGRKILASGASINDFISRTNLRAAIWLTYLGIRDYSYLINAAAIFHKHIEICKTSRDSQP